MRVLGRRTRRAWPRAPAAPGGRLVVRPVGGAHVRHPVAFAVGSLALLLALCAPVLSMQLGQSDAGSEPTSNTTRRAYDLVAQGFGPGSNGPLLVVADLRQPVDVEALRDELAGTEGVVQVSPPLYDEAQSVALLTVVRRRGRRTRDRRRW
jgi:RND superfamily putative drug exporter